MHVIHVVVEVILLAFSDAAHSPGLREKRKEHFLGMPSHAHPQKHQKRNKNKVSWLQAVSAAGKLQRQDCTEISADVTETSCDDLAIECPPLANVADPANQNLESACPEGFKSIQKCICFIKGALLDEIRVNGESSTTANADYRNRIVKLTGCMRDLMFKKQRVIEAFKSDTLELNKQIDGLMSGLGDHAESIKKSWAEAE